MARMHKCLNPNIYSSIKLSAIERRNFESERRIDFKTQNRNRQTRARNVSWNGGEHARPKQRGNNRLVKRKQRSIERSDSKLKSNIDACPIYCAADLGYTRPGTYFFITFFDGLVTLGECFRGERLLCTLFILE
jgi:hypothetical protein